MNKFTREQRHYRASISRINGEGNLSPSLCPGALSRGDNGIFTAAACYPVIAVIMPDTACFSASIVANSDCAHKDVKLTVTGLFVSGFTPALSVSTT